MASPPPALPCFALPAVVTAVESLLDNATGSRQSEAPHRSEDFLMLTLYYSPGACSMASHIALEETGAAYTPQPVLIPKGEHQSPEYLKNVNPRGKVPALKSDDGVSTENVAILT